jgi:hypothetical protein
MATRLTKLNKYKDKSPTYAGNTCKYIDLLIDVLDEEIKPLISDKDQDFFSEIQTQFVSELNYIRAANETLRDSSKYWYSSFKKEVK